MNILVIAQRVIQEILRDKRTLALMLFAPLMMISLIHFVFDSTSETTLQLAVDQKVPQSLSVPYLKTKSRYIRLLRRHLMPS